MRLGRDVIYHQGRLIDHVAIHVSDLQLSKAFYFAILSALTKIDGPSSNLHLAFQARSVEQVHAFYKAGIEAGGRDNGQPGYRQYHGSYYAAFLLDPDGNNIEAVCDVGAERSSTSVIVTRQGGDA